MAKQNIMSVTPVTRTRLHEEITEQLKNKIIGGELAPGEKLPSERKLAEVLGVNRTTLREAINKLESMELVEVRHGDGIYIKDYLESGSLELAKGLFFRDGLIDLDMLGNLLDLRKAVVPEAAYWAAVKRSENDVKEFEALVHGSDDMSVAEIDHRLHNLIARASKNTLFVILLNSFEDLAKEPGKLYFANKKNRERSSTFHEDILNAIKEKKPDEARDIMLAVLVYAEEATKKAVLMNR